MSAILEEMNIIDYIEQHKDILKVRTIEKLVGVSNGYLSKLKLREKQPPKDIENKLYKILTPLTTLNNLATNVAKTNLATNVAKHNLATIVAKQPKNLSKKLDNNIDITKYKKIKGTLHEDKNGNKIHIKYVNGAFRQVNP